MEDPCYRALRTARDVLARLERDHHLVRANMAAGTPTLTGGVATTDPDGNVTWTRVEADGNMRIALGIGRYQTLIEHALVNLLEADLMRGLNVTANTAPLATQDRCDGGAGEWANPSCEENALNDGNKPRAFWVDGRQHQLCQRCWDRQRQQKHREKVQ